MTSICASCHKHIPGRIYPNNMCEGCYNYFRKGGKINEIPPIGVIAKDERGYVICHICGMSYKRLGSHIKESHNMKMSEYREKFGLCRRSKATESSYSNKMHNYSYIYHMPERLMELGKNTRIKKGETDKRRGKPVREQERLTAIEKFSRKKDRK